MPYYHVIVGLKSRPHRGAIAENLFEQDLVNDIVKPYNEGKEFKCGDVIVRQGDMLSIKITESEQMVSIPNYFVSPQSQFADLWQAINREKDVTDKFIKKLPQRKEETIKETMPISKNVFIVHGNDYKPMIELKAMFKEFGLNPIVLHEKPSGSMTIIEKLEKYSNVDYAFVILTPDDVGASEKKFSETWIEIFNKIIGDILRGKQEVTWVHEVFADKSRIVEKRARQNVILEFGYFMGLLGRDKVCCLHKGDVELPSDMHGIVYIPFKNQ